jgi:hypothetical protein
MVLLVEACEHDRGGKENGVEVVATVTPKRGGLTTDSNDYKM